MQPPPAARAVTVAPERLARWLAGFAERHGTVETVTAPETVALTGADGDRAWIEVPFPPLNGDLVAHALRRRCIGVLLVRRGGHAAGVFDGADLVASKVGSSYVQGGTKAGGWSQQRYARRRANQANAAFIAAADAAVRVFGAAGSTAGNGAATAGQGGGTEARAKAVQRPPGDRGWGPLDALVAGGDREAVQSVLADRRLQHLPPISGSWLEVKDPRLRVLAATPEQFRAVRISLDP